MLKKVRILIASVFFILITLLFLDFTGTLHTWFGWMAKIQFLPAVLALNFGVIVILLLLTLLFGRVYCSTICPLGIMQDIISHFSSKRKGKKLRFGFKKENKVLRYGVLAVFVILMVAGINSIAILIAPYSAYGRIAGNLFAPIYQFGNNLFALLAEHFNSYAFYSVDVYIKSIPVFIVAVVTFIIIFVLAWRGGRTWCNNICPVGTALGLISRFSLFKPTIDTDKCINCGKCGKMCKASCIDTKEHKIDYSRCVVCMDCLENCSVKAISYSLRKRKDDVHKECDVDESKRKAIAIGTMLVTSVTLKAEEKKMDGGLAVLEDKKIPAREVSPKPAGSHSVKNFSNRCTGCQLCVSECPNKVLRPSTKLETFLQPEMSFEKGYCRPECTRCSELCPAGAIDRISPEEKAAIHIGHAVWIPENCIVNTDSVNCGNCSRHCPTGAILMVPKEKGSTLSIPSVDAEVCIGCGACENLCPARPLSAIYVEGYLVHTES